MNARRLVIIVVIAAAGLAAFLIFHRFRRTGPSVVLISVDTLRPDHLGCYGYYRETSPAVDRFARESLTFENCLAQAPTTRPSCGVMLSGFYPHELKIFNNTDNLPIEVTTLAEYLRDKGYRTIGVVSNFVLRRGGGFDQGFDYYDDRMDEVELVRGVPERIAEKTTDTAVDLLRIHRGHKLFMWIHYQDPHGPYTPRPPYNTMFVGIGAEPVELGLNDSVSGKGGIPSYQRLGGNRDYNYYVTQYDGEIRYFDEHFERLLDELKALGLYDTALIVFTSDHGEGMGEHDYYFAHGEYVYNSLIRVPLIIRFGTERQGTKTESVQLADVVPTILETVGIGIESGCRGTNLLGETAGGRDIFSERPGMYSIVRDGVKLVYHAEENEYLLFDIGADPYEDRNLIDEAEYAHYVRPLAARLAGLIKEDALATQVSRRRARLTEDEKEKLKALGYVQ